MISLSRVQCSTTEPFPPQSFLACGSCGYYELASQNPPPYPMVRGDLLPPLNHPQLYSWQVQSLQSQATILCRFQRPLPVCLHMPSACQVLPSHDLRGILPHSGPAFQSTSLMNIRWVQSPKGKPVCRVQCQGLHWVSEPSQTTSQGLHGVQTASSQHYTLNTSSHPYPPGICQRSTIHQLDGDNIVTYFSLVIMCSLYFPKYHSIQVSHDLDTPSAFPAYVRSPIQGYHRGLQLTVLHRFSSSSAHQLLTLVASPHVLVNAQSLGT